MAKVSTNLMKSRKLQILEAQQTPIQETQRKSPQVIIKFLEANK